MIKTYLNIGMDSIALDTYDEDYDKTLDVLSI